MLQQPANDKTTGATEQRAQAIVTADIFSTFMIFTPCLLSGEPPLLARLL